MPTTAEYQAAIRTIAEYNATRKDPLKTVEDIIYNLHGILPDQIWVKSRKGTIKDIRHCCQVILSNYTDYSYEYIGSVTGHKDHASICHARNRINDAADLLKRRGVNSPLLVTYKAIETHYRNMMGIAPDAPKMFRSYKEQVNAERGRR